MGDPGLAADALLPGADPASLPDALRAVAQQWLAAGRQAIVVQVVSTRGSVPRDAGTRMLVGRGAAQDSSHIPAQDPAQSPAQNPAQTAAQYAPQNADAVTVLGTIGGGHLEWQAIADARAMLASAATATATAAVQREVALGPSLGQCCGGALLLRLAPLTPAELQAWPDAPPRFTLQLYGAGHVGRAIVRLLAGLPCRVQWIDQRDEAFPPEPLPPHIRQLCAEPVEAEVAAAPPGCHYLVLTHSHALDLAIADAILRRNDVASFGLIGSKTKRARFEHRLLDRGIAPAALARMVCPIGVPGIDGKEPAVIAVAVVAQLLQHAAAAA